MRATTDRRPTAARRDDGGHAAARPTPALPRPSALVVYLLIGVYFGVVLMKSEVVSWFRIQEMFRFDSFHMYGIIGSALVVATVSLQLLKRFGVHAASGEPIRVTPKTMGSGTRYIVGGTMFGFGWALTGACPGPLFALLGSGVGAISVVIASALLGTWVYALMRPRLPH